VFIMSRMNQFTCGSLRVTAVLALGGLAVALGSAHAADEPVGRVLSATPVLQQVAVPSQVCSPERYVTREANSGAGALVGALTGGLLGSTVGHGPGRGAATVVGAVGGAVIGNQIEGSGGTRVQDVERCYEQTAYEERTVGYNVVYEYAGRQYQTRLDHDPGEYIALQVSAAGASAPTVTRVTTVRPARPVYVQAPPAVVYVEPIHYPPPMIGWGPGWGPHHPPGW
jgi:uncharacterized protein YcfJ